MSADDEHYNKPKSLGDLVQERNIILENFDPVLAAGFTQVPNALLNNPSLSIGAKLIYAKFLQYAWDKDHCYPGQKRLGLEVGLSEGRVSQLIKELKEAGLLGVKQRGLNQTNLYTLKMILPKANASKKVGKKGRG